MGHGFESQVWVMGDFAAKLTFARQRLLPRKTFLSILQRYLCLQQRLEHVIEPSQITLKTITIVRNGLIQNFARRESNYA